MGRAERRSTLQLSLAQHKDRSAIIKVRCIGIVQHNNHIKLPIDSLNSNCHTWGFHPQIQVPERFWHCSINSATGKSVSVVTCICTKQETTSTSKLVSIFAIWDWVQTYDFPLNRSVLDNFHSALNAVKDPDISAAAETLQLAQDAILSDPKQLAAQLVARLHEVWIPHFFFLPFLICVLEVLFHGCKIQNFHCLRCITSFVYNLAWHSQPNGGKCGFPALIPSYMHLFELWLARLNVTLCL